MTNLQVIETALKSAKAQVKTHLKANNLEGMKLALAMVKSLEDQLLAVECEGKKASEIIALGYFVVVDKITGKLEVFKKLSQNEINNFLDWDCVVMQPNK